MGDSWLNIEGYLCASSVHIFYLASNSVQEHFVPRLSIDDIAHFVLLDCWVVKSSVEVVVQFAY